MFWLLLIQFLLFISEVSGRFGILVARSDKEHRRFCMQYSTRYGNISETEHDAVFYPFLDLSPWDGCSLQESLPDMQNKIILVVNYTDSCSVLAKGVLLTKLGAAAVIILPNDTKSPSTQKSEKEPEKDKAHHINITVALIDVEVYEDLKSMGGNLSVKLYGPGGEVDRIDYSLIAIWVMAMFIVGIGSYWSGIIHYEYLQKLRLHRPIRRQTQPRTKSCWSKLCSKVIVASVCIVVLLVVLMSGLMLLLYYFYAYLVLFIIALFCIAATVAVFQIIDSLIRSLSPTPFMLPKIKIGKHVIKIAVYQIFLALLCVGFTLYWVFTRNKPYAWISQDILGIFFCVNILRTLRLPSAMLCTLLLVLLFVYDIIFVFVTPYLTKTGESIMVHVATGGGGTQEQV